MKKLMQTLRILDPPEFKKLDLYLHSPVEATHPPTLQLFEYLSPLYPDFPGDHFSEFSKVYQGEKLALRDFRLLSSYLLRRVHDFLAAEEWQRLPLNQSLALIASLIRRGLYREAGRQLDLAQKRLDQQSEIDSHNYLDRLRLQEFALELSFSQQMRDGDPPLAEYFSALDDMYAGLQMKYLLPAQALRRIMGKPFPEQRWRYCREQMEQRAAAAPVISQMFYHLLCLLQDAGKGHFQALLEVLDTHARRMARTERINVYAYLQNYLTQREGQNDPEALGQLFLLYRRMVEEGLVFGRGNFTEHLVRNITITGCRLGELEWTRGFLEENHRTIVASAGENVYAYVNAFLDFYSDRFSEALRKLQQVRFTDPFYRTGHQALLLRIYYELEDIESLEALAFTFRRYLNRSTYMSERQKNRNRAFISLVQLMARVRDSGMTSYRRNRIEQYLFGPQELTDRTWLLKKYEALA